MKGRRIRLGLGVALVAVSVTPLLPGASSDAATAEDWPMFHHDAVHSGVSSEITLGASNVAGLAVRWQANTGTAAYGSPAVVFNATLGKTLVYASNIGGVLGAYDAATGERIWYFKAGAAISSSPAVSNGVVYVGSGDHNVYALNATTGAKICSFNTGNEIDSSPVIADPDASGAVIFIGDNGLSGADDGGNEWAINAVDPNAAPDCSLKWRFNAWGSPPGSHPLAGSWSPPAFATDVNGRSLVVLGSSSEDDAVYALDARTGALVWRFQTTINGQDQDVGAGPTISAPGVNGFADGVAYVAGKDRIVYALNLRTGAKIWQFNIFQDAPTALGAPRSTAALVGSRLYLGYGAGVYALDAVTGAKVWRTDQVNGQTTGQVLSSPAIVGGSGDQVLLAGDTGGALRAYSLATGIQLWSYPLGGFIYGSPAVSGGRVFIDSSTGFLSAFGLGGFVSAQPDTTLTSPKDGAVIVNTGTSQGVAGAATDDLGVVKVLVAIKNRNTGRWWNDSGASWDAVFHANAAALSSPGATSTGWTYSFPITKNGGLFYAQAEAVDGDGQHDPVVASTRFQVSSQGNPPETTVTYPPTNKFIIYFPNGRARFPVTATGTANDTGGAHPGIRRVSVVVENLGHHEYYCGFVGCASSSTGETTDWTAVYTVLQATLTPTGATSVNWSITFPVYDHPHKYQVNAWAIDLDNAADQTHANRVFCIRDVGDNVCA